MRPTFRLAIMFDDRVRGDGTRSIGNEQGLVVEDGTRRVGRRGAKRPPCQVGVRTAEA